jgi:hypothetical protein
MTNNNISKRSSEAVNRIRIYNDQQQYIKEVIRCRKLKMDRLYNGQMKKDKQTNNGSSNTLYRKLKIKKQERHKKDGELKCPGMESISCSTSGTLRVTHVKNEVINLFLI